MERSEGTDSALDPDGNGVACEELWATPGFAPAHWIDSIPEDAIPAEVWHIIDGDTIEARINGFPDTIRLYRADAPETYEGNHCGGTEAREALETLLSANDSPDGVIYLQQDVTPRDRYGRLLGYVWLEIQGQPYMLNEALIRSGWAADINYGDERYDAELSAATEFSERHQLGLWQLCDGPLPPSEGPQGQPTPTGEYEGECDQYYPDVCIPPRWVYGDLDCKHVPHRRFSVLQPDPHGFDGDKNGVGCENYDTPYVGLP